MVASADISELRRELSRFLGFDIPGERPEFRRVAEEAAHGHTRLAVEIAPPGGEAIPAYMLVPEGSGPHPAVVVFHQHNGEWHLGKSEVAGLAGDPMQAFGPALARRGLLVLAPDSIAFEDRRRAAQEGEPGFLQHFNEMAYRLVRGEMLMTRVLADAALAVSALHGSELVRSGCVGVLGHSYGGNTALFHAALDERVAWAVSSGAVASYARKMQQGTGLEMALVVPGLCERWDIDDVLRCVAPRPLLVVSADADRYSIDADEIVGSTRHEWASRGAGDALAHRRLSGGHALTPRRFETIVNWVAERARRS